MSIPIGMLTQERLDLVANAPIEVVYSSNTMFAGQFTGFNPPTVQKLHSGDTLIVDYKDDEGRLMLSICDGHGRFGHTVSEFTAKSFREIYPICLEKSEG